MDGRSRPETKGATPDPMSPPLPDGGKALSSRTLFNPPPPNLANKTRNIYLIVICFLALAGTVSFLAGSWARIMAPFELDYGEGIVMWQAAHVTNLKAAYGDITHLPYIVHHSDFRSASIHLPSASHARFRAFGGRLYRNRIQL